MNNRKEIYKYLRDCLNGTIDPMQAIVSSTDKSSITSIKEKQIAAMLAEDILYYASYDPFEEAYLEGQGTMTNWQR